MPPQYAPYGIDLASIFAQAQQAKLAQAQMQQMQQQAEWQRVQHDMALRQAAEERAANAQKFEQERADKEAKRVANVQRYAAQLLQSNPIARDQVLNSLDSMKALPQGVEQAMAANNDPAVLAQMLNAASSEVLGAPAEQKPGELHTKLLEEGLQPGTREWYRRAAVLNGPHNQGTSVNIVNQMGPKDLTPQVRTKLTEGLVDASEAIDQLRQTMKAATPDLFTFKSRIKGTVLPTAEKMGVTGETTQEEIRKRTVVVQRVEQAFNAYRKAITGAAASTQEIERLRQSFMNTNQSWSEFVASANNYLDDMTRKMRIYRKVLREGIDLRPEDMQGAIADYAAAGEQANSAEDRVSRMRELKTRGLKPQQVLQRLVSEGYLSADEARAMEGGNG